MVRSFKQITKGGGRREILTILVLVLDGWL
jgi:hypothetical protein